jgi:hypothetical protein
MMLHRLDLISWQGLVETGHQRPERVGHGYREQARVRTSSEALLSFR